MEKKPDGTAHVFVEGEHARDEFVVGMLLVDIELVEIRRVAWVNLTTLVQLGDFATDIAMVYSLLDHVVNHSDESVDRNIPLIVW